MEGFTTQAECRRNVTVRLKKIEGQIRGIIKMVEENRDCSELIIQLAAVKAAISTVGAEVLCGYMGSCLEEGNAQENLDKFTQLLKKWY